MTGADLHAQFQDMFQKETDFMGLKERDRDKATASIHGGMTPGPAPWWQRTKRVVNFIYQWTAAALFIALTFAASAYAIYIAYWAVSWLCRAGWHAAKWTTGGLK